MIGDKPGFLVRSSTGHDGSWWSRIGKAKKHFLTRNGNLLILPPVIFSFLLSLSFIGLPFLLLCWSRVVVATRDQSPHLEGKLSREKRRDT